MQRFYATGRQRIVLGLGSLLVVCLLTLGNFWLSSSATAGDEKPLPDVKKDDANKKTPKVEPSPKAEIPGLPPSLDKVGVAEERSVGIPGLPPATPPVETGLTKPPAVSGVVTEPKPAGGESLVPPIATTPPPAPFVPTTPPMPSDKPTYSVPIASGIPTSSGATTSPSESNDIKQLMAQLNEIRAERGRLFEREKQTVEAIKKRFLEQRKALQQIEREMRALGVTPEEMAEDAAATTTPPPVRPTRY